MTVFPLNKSNFNTFCEQVATVVPQDRWVELPDARNNRSVKFDGNLAEADALDKLSLVARITDRG